IAQFGALRGRVLHQGMVIGGDMSISAVARVTAGAPDADGVEVVVHDGDARAAHVVDGLAVVVDLLVAAFQTPQNLVIPRGGNVLQRGNAQPAVLHARF